MAKGTKPDHLLELYRKLRLRKDFHYSNLPDWQKKIIEKYPDIYRVPSELDSTPYQISQPLADDYCNLRSGFECGPGWQDLIEHLSAVANELVSKLKDFGLQPDASIKPVVVKQKLGALRWQGRHNLSSPFDMLWLAYVSQSGRESIQTCEMSGGFGKIRSVGGFVICLSNKEYLKWKKNPQKQRVRYWQLEG
jgi:hypothetical protein